MKPGKNVYDLHGRDKTSSDPASKKVSYYPGIWKQYYATIAVCSASFAIGSSGGWVSPMILILESDDSPVGKMSTLDIGWLETLPLYAAIAGVLIFAALMDRFGRKISGYASNIVVLIGWFLLLSATTKTQLYVGRFLLGMSQIGMAMLGPIYLSEISYVSVRGTLMTYTQFAAQCGSLMSFILGSVCEYRVFTAINMISPLLFPILFIWIPESPQFLLLKGKAVEARNALLWYRGGDTALVDKEIISLSTVKKSDLTFKKVIKNKANVKALTIFLFMATFSVMSGTSVIVGYASKIFQQADSALEPNDSAAIMATIKFIAALMAIQLIDRFGRRVLVIFSYSAMFLCLVIITVYSFAQENGADVSKIGLLPVIVLSTYVFTNTVGVGTVGEVIASEMLTPEIKGVAIGIVGIILTVVTILSLQTYAYMVQYIGSSYNFLMESLFAFSAIFISWWIVPETKGKTLAEIIDILNGRAPYINKKTEVTKL